jgi:hypothetical protein
MRRARGALDNDMTAIELQGGFTAQSCLCPHSCLHSCIQDRGSRGAGSMGQIRNRCLFIDEVWGYPTGHSRLSGTPEFFRDARAARSSQTESEV